jgi:hypothetical protein
MNSLVLVSTALLFAFFMFRILLQLACFILSFILSIYRNSKLITAVFITLETEKVCDSVKPLHSRALIGKKVS